ncbi:MAG: YwaF family protein, partial [Lachnospiraceae bacterium]|nr:YwaF family protein [Lachnospiraceae bacterium]
MYIFLIGFVFSIILARQTQKLSQKKQDLLLIFLAFLFPVSELGKQILLYRSNHFSYDWWYFPFQLCSMPIYLLPLYCFLPKKLKKIRLTLANFLVDFGMLGGIFAFADTSGLHSSMTILTIHSYLWHFLMIFLGFFLIFANKNSTRPKDFLPPGALFLLLAIIATGFNFTFYSCGTINLFYISPHYRMGQIVFRDLALYTGQDMARCI